MVLNFYEQSQLIIDNYCSELSYSSLKFDYGDWCELFLGVAHDYDKRFYVRKLCCPPGFVEINKICECDPIIVNYGITKCDINNQTVLRPANAWIIATAKIPYSYQITEHCPLHYCIPHSSHINFSTPNSQCQFNRFGVLCGHCQQGLSTVFSSSKCHHCSNIHLVIIIPIPLIGLIFVFVLFYLNLTITNGTINAFTLYSNIISINFAIFFPQTNAFTPAYTFISLANLDLGVETCFYNGMDDYAKMWLQLAFPFYLIFIATLIIITSRYSTRIQRLTARRALPVLATLFLLSYTKILHIVSSVLFFYSTITHLPSKHTALVWSVDANVPLFGVRFTILFIVCLALFLILVPFNVILLFTRTLSRFRFINRFKPLLDAYQGPYKIRYYNYTGIELLIRVIFFALSSLERNINLVLGTIIFSVIIGIHGITSPLKNKWKYGSLKLNSLTVAKLNFEKPSVQLSAANGRQEVKISSGFYKGEIDLNSKLDVRQKGNPRVTTVAGLKGIDLQSMAEPVPALSSIEGNVNADVNVTTHGLLQSTLTRNLNGKVGFGIANGAFTGANFDKLVCEGIAQIRNKELEKTDWGPSTRFKNLSGSFDIRNGIASNDNLTAALSNLNLKGDGNVNLVQQTLDYHVGLNINGDTAPDNDPACQVNEDYVDVTWPVRCQGKLGEQHCGLDTERLADTIASLAKKEVQHRIEKEIEKKVDGPLKDVLKGFFK